MKLGDQVIYRGEEYTVCSVWLKLSEKWATIRKPHSRFMVVKQSSLERVKKASWILKARKIADFKLGK